VEDSLDSGAGLSHGVGIGDVPLQALYICCGEFRLCRAREATDRVSACEQLPDNGFPEETTSACDENFHVFPVTLQIETPLKINFPRRNNSIPGLSSPILMSLTNIISLGGNSRRNFLSNCAAAASLPVLAGLPINVFAAGSNEKLKVGVIGTGGRGTGAAGDCLRAGKGDVEIWAVGDLFENRVKEAASKFKVPAERTFTGFDAYQKVLETGVDLVILATPPGFRPLHLRAAIEKGVHVFAEKPVAVDPAGVRDVIAVGELAKQKKLSIVAGTQRRHENVYLETMKRIHDGAIGEIVSAQCYWCQGALWHNGGKDITDMEYQIRNWLYFTWLSGDHIVEQHVHNIDVINWAFGGPPVRAFGMGGRQTRVDAKYGDAFDHFSIEFVYPNDVRVQSFCRQAQGASSRIGERIVGTKGVAHSGKITGENPWTFSKEKGNNGYVQEHVDLIKAIRTRNPLNEAKTVAEATLTGILGRISAYTGKEVSFKWALEGSKLDLFPKQFAFGPGTAPGVNVAVPGRTQPV
jgi:predicted dehydrogenase